MVQDKTEYTFTEDIDSGQWASKNSIAFDSDTNRNNDNNTYCNRIIPRFQKYMGCNIYEASAGNVTNGSITGTVTNDSTIKLYVNQYVAPLALDSNLLEGRLITKDELINLGCSESELACPIEQYPWITLN